MSDRELSFLRVLATAKDALHSGRVARGAGVEYSRRMDAGATSTLDAMERRGLVRGRYDYSGSGGRSWTITEEGRRALNNAPPVAPPADASDTFPRP